MSNLPKFKTLLIDHHGKVLTITLNRQGRLNAFNGDMFFEVAQIAAVASTNADIRVVVFKGAGRAFSSGADLSDMSEGRKEIAEDTFELIIKEAQKTFDQVEAIPKPTIAAINGHAVGAGLQLALACDFRIVVKGVKLGLSDVKVGIIPALGATTRLPRLIGLAKSKELILSGDLIISEEALKIGLVNRIVEKDSLDHEVQTLTDKLMTRAPLALSTAKDLLNSEASLDHVAAAQSRLFKTADAIEGITAFLEKRTPIFSGS
jgi:enoyl-CoA hydratase/carnithine racemase